MTRGDDRDPSGSADGLAESASGEDAKASGDAAALRARIAELEARLREHEDAERERLAKALAERDRQQSIVLEHAPFQITIVDRDTRIRYINRVADGYSRADVEGQLGRDFIPEAYRAVYEQAIEGLFERCEPQHYEFADALGHCWDVHMVPVERDGVVDHAVSFSVDLAPERDAAERQREIEQQMQQAQKLESLGVLAGGIAHDFNNLLVGILGNAELLLDAEAPGDPRRRRLEGILDSGRRAAELCRQLLAYSGRGRFVVQRVGLSEVVREMTTLLEASISKRARLELELDEVLPAVQVDVTQLRQVMMNLLTNASDAVAEEGGTITVATQRVSYRADDAPLGVAHVPLAAGDYVVFEVRDSGHGMDEATRARMFEPFFSSKGAGRGLGLAAVQGMVWGHRGAITVLSEPGAGTAIRVALPAVEGGAERARDTGRMQPVGRARAGTVLVVDDEPSVRAVTSVSLHEAGYQVLQACDGTQAVEVYREHRRQVVAVLLDMTMPGMDGSTTLRALAEIDPDVRVVLTSGYDEGDQVAQLGPSDRVTFLPKPARLRDLLQAVDFVARPARS